jgi:hypothetical protein
MMSPRAYDEARALVGSSEHAGYAGGRSRYVTFEERPRFDGSLDIAARMFATDIVTWHPDGQIVLDTGGYSTPSTFDGMVTALGIPRSAIGTRQYVPHYCSIPFDLTRGLYRDHYTLTINPEGDESGGTELS